MKSENGSEVVGDFVGYLVLVKLFDGDADRWLHWLRTEGSDSQIISDYPFAVWVKSEMKADPDLIHRVRTMVEEFEHEAPAEYLTSGKPKTEIFPEDRSFSQQGEQIRNTFQRFRDKHDGNVFFHAAFGVFDENGDVTDDLMLCYGDKDVVKISLDAFIKEIEKEGDFVVW